MTEPSNNAAWRAACQELAQRRGHEESLLLWGLPEGTTIPFEYRWEHVKQVVEVALKLADALAADSEVVEAAAWLHDICKMEPKHALAGAREAAPFLATTDFPPHKVALVVDAIAKHEGFYRPEGAPSLEPIEAAVLWDADKLTKLGVNAVLFAVASPYVKGEGMAARYTYAESFSREVLARTVTSMNTDLGRALAEQRYADQVALLAAWASEQDELGASSV